MAPRTLLPCRMSGCSRVARVTATASATSRSYSSGASSGSGARNATMPRSAAASW
jgi:hypothetical protein